MLAEYLQIASARLRSYSPELDGDFVVSESEELFAKLVVMLLVPFPLEEVINCFSASQEPLAVAPDAVRSVGFGDFSGSLEQRVR